MSKITTLFVKKSGSYFEVPCAAARVAWLIDRILRWITMQTTFSIRSPNSRVRSRYLSSPCSSHRAESSGTAWTDDVLRLSQQLFGQLSTRSSSSLLFPTCHSLCLPSLLCAGLYLTFSVSFAENSVEKGEAVFGTRTFHVPLSSPGAPLPPLSHAHHEETFFGRPRRGSIMELVITAFVPHCLL